MSAVGFEALVGVVVHAAGLGWKHLYEAVIHSLGRAGNDFKRSGRLGSPVLRVASAEPCVTALAFCPGPVISRPDACDGTRWNACSDVALRPKAPAHAKGHPMFKALVIAVGLVFASAPSLSQIQMLPDAQAEAQILQLPVYSSDGQNLGRIMQVAVVEGKLKGVRAELGESLGIGTAAVLIGAEVLEQKPDRLEITMTAAQVRDVLVRQKEQKQ